MLTASQIVEILGGTNATARFFGVKPPSVCKWVTNGVIPEGKLLKRAAALERSYPDRFSRQSQWPSDCHEIWPDLQVAGAQAEVH